MDELKSCGVLVFRAQPCEAFLLMEHADRLDLPKGHIHPGESEAECALRELEEETGIPPACIEMDPAFRFVLHYPVRNRRTGGQWREKTVVVFLARLHGGSEVNATEHIGHRWIPWSPPHHIQQQTIDPLLAAVEAYRRG